MDDLTPEERYLLANARQYIVGAVIDALADLNHMQLDDLLPRDIIQDLAASVNERITHLLEG